MEQIENLPARSPPDIRVEPQNKRLALFFDGTWNVPEDHTNVRRLYDLVSDCGPDHVPQRAFYDPGVGTHWYDRITGGAFGAGLWNNVMWGYRTLVENYREGDDIFLFGFSRGAFTARSVAGIIARCGLLKSEDSMSIDEIFQRYRQGNTVRAIYEVKHLEQTGKGAELDAEERKLLQNVWYHRNLVKMTGVWDTVGSIGVPFGDLPGISSRTLHFYDTHLSTVVQNSFQALAVDEHRKPYWAILWTSFTPQNSTPAPIVSYNDRLVEQRWFCGAHANVGGGYAGDVLYIRPLAWMQQKAASCGLAFRDQVRVTDGDLTVPPRNSYAEFLDGIWKHLAFLPFAKWYDRWIQSAPVCKEGRPKPGAPAVPGMVKTVNERIDASVFQHCQLTPNYRPPNLLEWARRKNYDLDAVIQNPKAFPNVTDPITQPGIE